MDDATWELILRNLWPMLRATVTATIPLTAISFVLGLVLALFVALARISRIRPLSLLARGYVSVIRGTPLLVQLFIVFYALPQFEHRDRPVPGGRDRVQPERGRVRGRGDPRGDPEHPAGPVGGRADDRHGLPDDAAAGHPAAGRAHRRAAAVEHVDLAGQGHLAGLDHPGHRAAAGGPARGRADVRLLRALRRRGRLLLGDLRGPLVLPGQAGDAAGRYVASDDRSADRPGRPQGVRRPRGAAGHLVRRAGGHGHRGDRAVGLGQDDRAAHAQRAGPGRRRGHHDRRRVGRLRRRPRTAPPWRASGRRAAWSSRATTCSRT